MTADSEIFDFSNEVYQLELNPDLRDASYPGAIVNANGTPNPQEINPAAPTGYLPDARTVPQAAYDRDQDTSGIVEYDPTFPVEPLDSAETVDQHAFMNVTATITADDDDPRKTGTRDPMVSGPARPDTVLLSLQNYRGAGTDNNKYMDVPDGRTFPLYGSQDGTTWTVYENAQDATAPLDTSQSPVPDDPSQNVRAQSTWNVLKPGPAHGWTSVPVVNVKAADNLKSTKQLRQQQAPHQDRKANSTVAGQTYSQQTASVSQSQGHVAVAPNADDQWW